jgi:hypothetical protein
MGRDGETEPTDNGSGSELESVKFKIVADISQYPPSCMLSRLLSVKENVYENVRADPVTFGPMTSPKLGVNIVAPMFQHSESIPEDTTFRYTVDIVMHPEQSKGSTDEFAVALVVCDAVDSCNVVETLAV